MPVLIKLGPFDTSKPEKFAFINPEYISSISSYNDNSGNRTFSIYMVGEEDPYIVSLDVFEEFMGRCEANNVSFVSK